MQTIKNSKGQWKIPDYGPNSRLFSFRTHFGGEFKNTPTIQYVGGCIDITDYCNADYLSFDVLDDMAQQLCLCDTGFSFYYLKPGLEIEDGLVHVSCDAVIEEMVAYGVEHKLIDLFIVKKGNGQDIPSMPTVNVVSPPKGRRIKMAARKRVKTPVKRRLNIPSELEKDSANGSANGPENGSEKGAENGTEKGSEKGPENGSEKGAENGPEKGSEKGPETGSEKGSKKSSENATEKGSQKGSVKGVGNHPSKTSTKASRRAETVKCKTKKSSKKGKQKETEEVEQDEEALNLSDRERWHDSDYEFSDEEDLGTIITEREKEWEQVASLFRVPRRGNDEKERRQEVDDSDEDVAYSDEVELHSSSESEDHVSTSRKATFKRFRPETDMNDPHFTIGMIFSSRDEFKAACKHHGVKHGRRIRFPKNDKQRVTATCNDCEWLVSIVPRPNDEGWQVRRTNVIHSCGTTWNHGCANSAYLSRKYKEDFRIMPHMKPGEFAAKVYSDMKLNISKSKARNTKKMAVHEIVGDYTEQYNKLHDYCNEVCRANPGSNVFIKTVENEAGEQVFQRLYFCLEACKRGFNASCRPLIGLDGCHLRGPHKGILLTAVGLDPNDQIFPISVAVVEIENKVTWKWFLGELMEDLKIRDPTCWTFITDKQKGLSNAISELLPGSEHRMCVWHMLQNFKKVHNGLALYDALWACSKASYLNKFATEMERLKGLDEAAYNWVRTHTTPTHWSRSHFRIGSKCDILVNNICECFNRVLLDAREKPILAIFESIRFYLMVRMENKRARMMPFKRSVCPKIQAKLELIKAKACECIATHAGEMIYEVRCMYGDQFTVDLRNRTCSCRRWELNGIPCAHAVSAIGRTTEEPEVFVHECYSKEAYLKAYEHVVYPINGENLWEKTNWGDLLPPENIRLPGRPKKARRKGEAEILQVKRKGTDLTKLSRAGQMTYKCTICKETGHNSRRCPSKTPEMGSNAAQQPQPSIPNKRSVASDFGQQSGVKRMKAQKCSLCRKAGHNRINCREDVSGLYHSNEPQSQTNV